MKRFLKIVATLLCTCFITVPFAACDNGGGENSGDSTSQTSVSETPSASITYSGSVLENATIGEAYTASVATATGATGITYELDLGQWLPEGMELSSDGTISGTPTETGTFEFKVVASAGDVSRTAQFTITVESASVSNTGRTLSAGTTYAMYADTLFDVENVNSALSYSLAEGSTLPDGLKVTTDGYIIGIPKTTVTDYEFIVTTSGKGYEDTDVTYTITINEGTAPQTASELTLESITLDTATVGTVYFGVLQATGAEDITYARKAIGGVGLPSGLSFDSCGLIYGIPEDSTSGQMSFNLTASADGYDSVTATCYLTVLDIEVESNILEAEYIDLTGKQGAGYSSSPAGKQIIQKFSDASNGACVGYLLTEISLDFSFRASAADSSATLSICLASEIGQVTFTPDSMDIAINGVSIEYGSLTVDGGQQEKGDFQLLVVTDSLNLIEGDNTITITIKTNTLRGGSTGGPIIDYLSIDSSATIYYRPKVSNV